MQDSNLTQVTPAILLGCLEVITDIARPIFIWGHPGIGKSAITASLAEPDDVALIDVRASQLDAVDTRGVPFTYSINGDGTNERRTGWAIPDLFPTEEFAAKFRVVYLFLDELNNAPPSVQAALYQLVLDRCLGAYTLPANVVIVAAGNLETDRGATYRMATPLASRFFHVQLIVDGEAWEQWALQNDVHTAVIAFRRWRPESLHDFDPKSKSKAQPDPRAWHMVSDAIKSCETQGINGAVETAIVSGKVGEAFGAEFVGFLKIYRNLPDPAAVILAPDQAAISKDPAVNFALCGALAQRATDTNIDNILQYAERMGADRGAGPEFMTLLARQCAIRNPSIQSTRGFIKWASSNPDVLIS